MLAVLAAIAVAVYAIHDGLGWFDWVWAGVALFMLHFAVPVAVPSVRR